MRLPQNISKCLIVKPSSLGDIIHSLPFLSALHKCFREAEIHWLVSRKFSSLLDGHPMIARLHSVNQSHWKNISRLPGTISEFNSLRKSLRNERYDMVIDLQGLLRSGLISALASSPVRVGLSSAREGATHFYTHKIDVDMDDHAVDRYLKVAAALGCDTDKIEFPMLHNDYPLKLDEYAVITPGARWESKIWPPDNFGTLASLLPVKSVIVGASADVERAEVIEKHAMGNAINLAGKTSLRELAGIIRNASFMVTNDSGPMHIAAGFGVPVYALFGPTSPERTGPYGTGHKIIRAETPCAPCFKKSCSDLRCLEDISPAQVLEEIMANSALTF